MELPVILGKAIFHQGSTFLDARQFARKSAVWSLLLRVESTWANGVRRIRENV